MNNHLIVKKYADKGLSGLANLGNTCFINSCLAILSHTYEMNDFLDSEKYAHQIKLKQSNDVLLLTEWNNLRKLLWDKNAIISPNKFIWTIHIVANAKNFANFTDYSQNDIEEFLLFIVDSFHDALSREVDININGKVLCKKDKLATKCYEIIKQRYAKDYSEIWNLFYAIQVTELSDMNTKKVVSVIPEPFFVLNLPIPFEQKTITLYDCFDLYVMEENMVGDNGLYNEKTKSKYDANKRVFFWSFPTILVINLKRYNNMNRKKQNRIDFPLEGLNLAKYAEGYKNNSYVYDLYGVCNHSGGVLGGHYTSYVKNANGKWYLFNDTSVAEVPKISSIISPKAYCLFYRKRECGMVDGE